MPGHADDDPRFLEASTHVEGVFRMVLELASELWVTRDRFLVMEHLLDVNGVVTRDDIEAHQPTGELAFRLKADRERLMSRLLQAAAGMDPSLPESPDTP